MSEINFYEMADVLETFGNKTLVAAALGIDRSQVTRWGSEIPGGKQLDLLRFFDRNPDIKKEYSKVKRAREKLEKERGNGQLPE